MFSLLEDLKTITKYKFTFRPKCLPSVHVKLPDFSHKESLHYSKLVYITRSVTDST